MIRTSQPKAGTALALQVAILSCVVIACCAGCCSKTITVQVVEHESGMPLSGVKVAHKGPKRKFLFIVPLPRATVAEGKTDPDGKFTFRHVQPCDRFSIRRNRSKGVSAVWYDNLWRHCREGHSTWEAKKETWEAKAKVWRGLFVRSDPTLTKRFFELNVKRIGERHVTDRPRSTGPPRSGDITECCG